MFRISLRKQNGEFLSPIAAYHIKLTQLLIEDGRDLPQDFVSEQMSKFVVQTLELINIHHDHSHTSAESLGPFKLFGNAQLKEAPIENSRESVQIRQLFHPFHIMRILNSSRANIGYRFQGLCIAGVKRPSLRTVQNQHSKHLSEGNQRNTHASSGFHIEPDVIRVAFYIVLNHRFSRAQGLSP